MDDVVEMKELKANKDAADDEFGLGLFEPSSAAHVVAEISPN